MINGKDALPSATVRRIKGILLDLGINTRENWFETGVKGSHAIRVEIEGTNLGTNGKGISADLALASAYGELMERLQNGVLYKLNLDPKLSRYGGFYFQADEELLTRDALVDSHNPMLEVILKGLDTGGVGDRLDQWLQLDSKNKGHMLCCPYYSTKLDTLLPLPVAMRTVYGTNGMCAGNTPEEAIVQGLSEILERAAQLRILRERQTPPEISRDEVRRFFPSVDAIAAEIEEAGALRIRFKDCSVIGNWPVYAALVVSQERREYVVKFASHPIPEIALQRTLTEFCQGRNAAKPRNMFEYGAPVFSVYDNEASLLRSSYGAYPDEFFLNGPGRQFNNRSSAVTQDNRVLLQMLVDSLHEAGHDVLIRDFSYLGFPAFHVIVPGLSEVFGHDAFSLRSMKALKSVRKIMRNLSSATMEELELAVLFINYSRRLTYKMGDGMKSYYGVPLTLNSDDDSLELTFIATASMVLGQWLQATKALGSLAKRETDRDRAFLYNCLHDYAGLMDKGKTQDEAATILRVFYPESCVLQAVSDVVHARQALVSKYGRTNNWCCGECDARDICSYETIARMISTLKDRHLAAHIDQSQNRRLFKQRFQENADLLRAH